MSNLIDWKSVIAQLKGVLSRALHPTEREIANGLIQRIGLAGIAYDAVVRTLQISKPSPATSLDLAVSVWKGKKWEYLQQKQTREQTLSWAERAARLGAGVIGYTPGWEQLSPTEANAPTILERLNEVLAQPGASSNDFITTAVRPAYKLASAGAPVDPGPRPQPAAIAPLTVFAGTRGADLAAVETPLSAVVATATGFIAVATGALANVRATDLEADLSPTERMELNT